MSRPPRERDPVPLVQEAPVSRGEEGLAPSVVRIPNPSESVYRLRCLSRRHEHSLFLILKPSATDAVRFQSLFYYSWLCTVLTRIVCTYNLKKTRASRYFLGDQVKKTEVGRECSTTGGG